MKSPVSISIITPCLNRKEFIAEAIESVLQQQYSHFEHIIIDGGSTDGTLEILDKYSHLNVISEKDKGLYDAINKGLAIAKGHIIGLLNSDDFYEPDIFKDVSKAFDDDPALLHFCGQSQVFQKNGDEIKIINIRKSKFCMELNYKYIIYHPFQINARFFRNEIFKNYGMFSLDYSYMADLEFMLRLTQFNIKSKNYYAIVYNYRKHPGSITFNSNMPNYDHCYAKKFQIAKMFLKSENCNKRLRSLSLDLHANAIYDNALFKLKNKNYSDIISIIREGLEFNMLLPFRAFRYIYWFIIRHIKVKVFRSF